MSDPNYSAQLLVEEYKNRFELEYPLKAIANLIRINEGLGFSPSPFKGLSQNGRQIADRRGRIIKGLAVRWLIASSPSERLADLIRQSYVVEMRNALGGHNSYRFDDADDAYIDLKSGVSYPRQDLERTNSMLDDLQSILVIESGLYRYRELLPIEDIAIFGNMDVRWDTESDSLDQLVVFKHWGNYREYVRWPHSLAFFPSPIRHDNACSITLVLGNTSVFPYDLRIFTNEATLLMLRKLQKLDRINLLIAAVAPPMPGLVEYEIARTMIAGKDASVLDKTHLTVAVPGDLVAQTADFVEQCLRDLQTRC